MSLPNQLTVLRMILTPLFAVALIFEHLFFKYLSLIIFVLASLTDWYDGYFARKHGSVTRAGKYLDPLADKLLISTAFGIFTFLGYVQLWMFMVIALRDILITGLRSYAISRGKLFATSIWAKWKTATQMFAIYCIFIWMIVESSYSQEIAAPVFLTKIKDWDLLGKLMVIVTIYTVTTGVSYLYENRQHLKSLAVAFYRVFVPTNVR
ncbi:MAG: CDP-diacylglycerol--glycerol-3-phosphate 3-phosphatidyltransferase [bacterium]